jgi:hypothetical protein
MNNSAINSIKHNPMPPKSTRSKSDIDDPIHLPKIEKPADEKKKVLLCLKKA